MVINVTQYNNFLKALVDNEPMLAKVLVTGEVSNLFIGGESVFFSLKDDCSMMDCFAFLDKLNFLPTNGSQVLVEGRPNYLKNGKISFTVSKLTLTGSEGEQFQKFLKLKTKLEKAGYFDSSNKLPLPKYVFNIAVVSSGTGAVIHDIHTVLSRRNKYARITLFDSKVQGDDAANQIADAIARADQGEYDVIIVARGGGSNEDLSAFNTEVVAKAVFFAKTPILSAVGHETDYTICDYCADIRASTPSVAAELISSYSISEDLRQMLTKLYNITKRKVELSAVKYYQALDKITNNCNAKITKAKSTISATIDKCCYILEKKLLCSQNDLTVYAQKLNYLSPYNTFKTKGVYVLHDGKIVTQVDALSKGDKIKIVFSDGELNATIGD